MRVVITARAIPSQPAARLDVGPVPVRVRARPLRVLDVDTECRPLHWISGDYVSKEITAMAWAWTDRPDDVTCYLLGETDPIVMLEAFRAAYTSADVVTGHYIRAHDVPLINGAMTEYGLAPLGDKLISDTKIDLIRRSGLSGSQENLGAMLGLSHPKVKMDQSRWRDANRLTASGRAAARERVVGDVQQHIELRHKLLKLGYLAGPKLWRSGSAAHAVAYTP